MDSYALVLLQETQKKPSVYLLIISRVRPINFQSQDCSKISGFYYNYNLRIVVKSCVASASKQQQQTQVVPSP